MDDFSKQKIMWIELVDRPNFALDETGIMMNNTVFFLTGSDMHYLLAYLNSTLCDWHFGNICATSGVGTRRWFKQYVEQILIPRPTEERLTSIVPLIEQQLAGESQEKAIDQAIYAIYGFTQEEIAIIEGII